MCWFNPKCFSTIISFDCGQLRSIPFGGVLQRGGVGVFSPNTFSSLTSEGTWGDLTGLNSGVNPRVALKLPEELFRLISVDRPNCNLQKTEFVLSTIKYLKYFILK